MTTLPQNQHVSIAGTFLEKSASEFAAGDALNGAELLWGATAHALIAVAQENGWDSNSHRALRDVAKRLESNHGSPQWLSDFSTAERFHIHFYHGRLTDRQIARDRPKVGRLVSQLLSLLVIQ